MREHGDVRSYLQPAPPCERPRRRRRGGTGGGGAGGNSSGQTRGWWRRSRARGRRRRGGRRRRSSGTRHLRGGIDGASSGHAVGDGGGRVDQQQDADGDAGPALPSLVHSRRVGSANGPLDRPPDLSSPAKGTTPNELDDGGAADEEGRNRQQEEPQVVAEGPAVDVGEVEADHVVVGQRM